MAKRPRPATPIGTPLPRDWRPATWRISAMLAKIPQSEYETQWQAFEAANRGRLSADWTEEWRAHCRRVLVERATPEAIGPGLFGLV